MVLLGRLLICTYRFNGLSKQMIACLNYVLHIQWFLKQLLAYGSTC
uniref:Uncharacterized protein n=1 Tax=Arundo donax TaxID=35708 RepID=A0A0A8ZEC2_ARUDO